jgi:hypothetical protein
LRRRSTTAGQHRTQSWITGERFRRRRGLRDARLRRALSPKRLGLPGVDVVRASCGRVSAMARKPLGRAPWLVRRGRPEPLGGDSTVWLWPSSSTCVPHAGRRWRLHRGCRRHARFPIPPWHPPMLRSPGSLPLFVPAFCALLRRRGVITRRRTTTPSIPSSSRRSRLPASRARRSRAAVPWGYAPGAGATDR